MQNCPHISPQPFAPMVLSSIPSPRTMHVEVPFSTMGVTVVTMDRDGNVTIKVDQVPESTP
jgi:hypothetical protein